MLSIDSLRPQTQANDFVEDGRQGKESMQTEHKKRMKSRNDNQQLDEKGEDDIDWVATAGHLVPGAKLAAIRTLINSWFQDSTETIVIMFTQFLDMVRILSYMCEKEGWGYTTVRKSYSLVLDSFILLILSLKLTGRTSIASRHDDIDQFRKSSETRIMISSLKAGGTGLNLTMANKCILVDLWWNEAVEQQVK